MDRDITGSILGMGCDVILSGMKMHWINSGLHWAWEVTSLLRVKASGSEDGSGFSAILACMQNSNGCHAPGS